MYDYIEAMQARPNMFTEDKSLRPLELLLYGYCACIQANDIEEKYEGRKFHPTEFSGWLYDELGWSGSLGFAHSIEENVTDTDVAFDTFFGMVLKFRESKDAN